MLDLLAQGLTGEEVAERLVLSSETIKTHIRNAMTKLEANTRVHAIAIALREGYISPPDDAEAEQPVTGTDATDGARRLRHDLRTPLTVVTGFAEILAGDRPVTDDERRDYAQRIAARRGRDARADRRRAKLGRSSSRRRRLAGAAGVRDRGSAPLRGFAGGEVRAAAERAVVARPARAVGQLLLQPVERAEPAAEVVDHVHERRLARAGDDRRAVLERAVVAEDDVQHGAGEVARGKPGRSSISAPHAVVAERDLALELAEVGHVDRRRVGRVGLELADVVQQRAGDGDVAVDARERGRRWRRRTGRPMSECSSSPWR